MTETTETTETKKTSQNIFTTLETLKTATSVPIKGQKTRMYNHTLPRDNYPTDVEFEDKDALVAWVTKKDIIHACLQLGVKAFLINDRARFKAQKKGETWSEEIGQKNVNEAKWTVQEKIGRAHV